MILYIDTTDFNKVTFSLDGAHKGKSLRRMPSNGFRKTYKVDPRNSNEIVAKLDEFLHKSKILNPKSQILKIVVNKGPGSFTGVRVGVTIAQALSLAWGAPVKTIVKDKFIVK
jgi:tRNA A37 threonylcarbamoyladenosine modification protein TsaB